MKKRFTGAAAFAAVVGLSALSARAAVLYATSFESPTFTAGNIVGQDGWTATTGGGNLTVQMLTAGAHTGDQFAFYNTANATNAAPSKFAWEPINRTVAQMTATPELSATVFTRIQENTGTTRTAIAGLDLYNIAGARIAAINFGTDGAVLPLDPNGAVTLLAPVTATLSEYHKLNIQVDYLTQAVNYYFDNTLIATSTSANATDFGDGDIYAIRTTNPSGSSGGHQIVWDDLIITANAVPEPTTCVLPVVFGLLAARRRREGRN